MVEMVSGRIFLGWMNSYFGLIAITLMMIHIDGGGCSNILLMPFAFRSHVSQLTAIASGLKDKGHRVFILLPETYPHLDELKKDYNLVVNTVKYKDMYSKPEEENKWLEVAMRLTPIQEFRTNIDGFIQMCTNPLEDKTLQDKLRKLRIDLAIVDGFPCSRCLYAIVYKLGIPYISVTTQYEPWLWRNPALPSFVPFPLAGIYTERMTLGERIQNLITLVDWTAWPAIPYMEESYIKPYLPRDDGMTYSKLAARSLLWLIDTDVAIDYPRPTMANEIYIGGLSTRPSRPLPKDLEEFASGPVKGFIIVSFGSSGILDDDKSFDILASAFSRLEQRVFWKYSREVPNSWSTKIPSNVRILKWLPQNDLLGHKNCRLFVTHCGANSQFEALYHGVPMLGIPIYADQPYNARRAEYLGYGRFLSVLSVTTDALVESILEILGNSSYRENIGRGSAIFKDRPQTPKERAVWWVEHVLRHGGKHLHSIALDMPWYEYLMLDVFLLLVIFPVVVSTSFLTCFCVWLFTRKGRVEKLKKN